MELKTTYKYLSARETLCEVEFFWEVCVHKEQGSYESFIVAAYVPLANCQIVDLGVVLLFSDIPNC